MGEAQYDFYILVTCLLILALQIHNPFQSRPVCQCTGEGAALPGGLGPGDGFAAPPIGAAAAAQRVAEPPPQPQQAAASRRPRAAAAAPSGAPALSESDLLRELQSIQAKAKDQQEVLAAAGRMPPPSPILQQLKESEAAQAGARGARPRRRGGRGRRPPTSARGRRRRRASPVAPRSRRTQRAPPL
ncbi:unnamed protein product [Prorocentrum cordatum]|uniref:Uncharacterized protein n=1 Tax=Prorocentrum cordatum TaxID=2364126 RepID=A0ABN9WZ98_9DINO|nr:unnamed protein product [Polarella glacialis]